MRELTRAFLEQAGHAPERVARYERDLEALRAGAGPGPRAPVREEYLAAPDGARVFVQSAVPPSPRALVLAQAGKECHGDLHLPLADRLHARGVGLVAVDNRGHGRSGPARGAFDDAALLFPVYDALLERHAGVPCHFLGESLGAAVAVAYAAGGGGRRLRSLVLLSPPCRFRRERLVRAVLPALRAGLSLASAALGGRPLLRFRARPRPGYHAAYRTFDVDDLVRAPRSTPAHLAAALSLAGRFHEHAARLSLPMLVLAGEADSDFDPRGAVALAQAGPERRCVVYPGAEHSLLFDRSSAGAYDEIARWVEPAAAARIGA